VGKRTAHPGLVGHGSHHNERCAIIMHREKASTVWVGPRLSSSSKFLNPTVLSQS
jgi:hypothetical protein